MKNKIFIALTVVVIIFCGVLPRIIAGVEDFLADQKISYAEAKTVSFVRELNDLEKIYLLKNGTEVSVSKNRTNLKKTNMVDVLETALSWYVQNGFIKGQARSFTITNCEPVLYYSTKISNVAGVFWKIDMELWDYYNQNISLVLDDQTGKVLLIEYQSSESIYLEDDLPVSLMYLYNIYQSERLWYDAMDTGVEKIETVEGEKYKGKCESIYRMGDIAYGEVGVRFIMTEKGFSIQVE